MKSLRSNPRLFLFLALAAPSGLLLSGCIVTSAAKAGLAVGGAAAKTTVGVAGAAAGAAGSAVSSTVSGDDPAKEEDEE